jgi:hypothetical protein
MDKVVGFPIYYGFAAVVVASSSTWFDVGKSQLATNV